MASESLDAYYQEVGRAGRDGLPARAVLFFSERDLNLKRFFAGGHKLGSAELDRVLGALRTASETQTPASLMEQTGLTKAKVNRALTRLEDQGVIERDASGTVVFSPGATLDLRRLAGLRSRRKPRSASATSGASKRSVPTPAPAPAAVKCSWPTSGHPSKNRAPAATTATIRAHEE